MRRGGFAGAAAGVALGVFWAWGAGLAGAEVWADEGPGACGAGEQGGGDGDIAEHSLLLEWVLRPRETRP